jgi:squalene-hopene/tetraprenyl-beta-curcumene cyclase
MNSIEFPDTFTKIDRMNRQKYAGKRANPSEPRGGSSGLRSLLVHPGRNRSTLWGSFERDIRDEKYTESELLNSAIHRAQAHLLNLQRPEGFWLGELEANSTLYADYIAFMHWSGEIDSDLHNKCVRHLLATQLPDGGWSIYRGGPAELDPSVKAYFALKLAGMKKDDSPMARAAILIRKFGGIEKARYYTRFYLALFGQIPWKDIPAVPVELVLAPRWSPINLYSVSAWTRAMLVPLAIVHHFQPTQNISFERGVAELFTTPDRRAVSPKDKWFSWCLTLLKWLQRCAIVPSREAALVAAEQWIVARTNEGSSGLGAIFPSILQMLIALRCLGYDTRRQIYRKAKEALRNLFLDGPDGFRIQPCLSPIWDTALSMLSLTESGLESSDLRVQKAAKWLAARRVTVKGDWAVRLPNVEPSGWSFEFENPFYPDVDDTAMVMLALSAANFHEKRVMRTSLGWLMALQCGDGGWAAFDRNVQNPWLRFLPFADHKAILDPSCPDITGRVLEVLGKLQIGKNHPSVRRALRFLRTKQEKDGSWYGRWGVNYIYGTSQVLRGLRAIGIDTSADWIQRGRQWLETHQNDDGGWGESCASYLDPDQKGKGKSTASQTAWALMGLCAFPELDRASIRRGVAYLVGRQKSDGSWNENLETGTGFPGVIYLRYDYYRRYWPLRALAIYSSCLKRLPQSPLAKKLPVGGYSTPAR